MEVAVAGYLDEGTAEKPVMVVVANWEKNQEASSHLVWHRSVAFDLMDWRHSDYSVRRGNKREEKKKTWPCQYIIVYGRIKSLQVMSSLFIQQMSQGEGKKRKNESQN